MKCAHTWLGNALSCSVAVVTSVSHRGEEEFQTAFLPRRLGSAPPGPPRGRSGSRCLRRASPRGRYSRCQGAILPGDASRRFSRASDLGTIIPSSGAYRPGSVAWKWTGTRPTPDSTIAKSTPQAAGVARWHPPRRNSAAWGVSSVPHASKEKCHEISYRPDVASDRGHGFCASRGRRRGHHPSRQRGFRRARGRW